MRNRSGACRISSNEDSCVQTSEPQTAGPLPPDPAGQGDLLSLTNTPGTGSFFGHIAFTVYQLYKRKIIFSAYVCIVFTECRCDMNHAGTVCQGNVRHRRLHNKLSYSVFCRYPLHSQTAAHTPCIPDLYRCRFPALHRRELPDSSAFSLPRTVSSRASAI